MYPGGRGYPGKKPEVKKASPATAFPKPINLPSRRKENNGFDPNIQLVGSGSWAASQKPGTGSSVSSSNSPLRSATVSATQDATRPSQPMGWNTAPVQPSSALSSTTNTKTETGSEFPKLGDNLGRPTPPVTSSQDWQCGNRAEENSFSSPFRQDFSTSSAYAKEQEASKKEVSPPPLIQFSNHDWAEDDDDEMDFQQPIVIAGSGNDASKPQAKATIIDPKEEAIILARKKQQELERMQEELIIQQRRADIEAFEREKRLQEEAEQRRRQEEMEQKRQMMEERERRFDRERERDRWRSDETRRSEEDRWSRVADFQRNDDEKRSQEREVISQNELMKKSIEAARKRREEEEQKMEAERRAAAQARLAEIEEKLAARAKPGQDDVQKRSENNDATETADSSNLLKDAEMEHKERNESILDKPNQPVKNGNNANYWRVDNRNQKVEWPDTDQEAWRKLREDDRPETRGILEQHAPTSMQRLPEGRGYRRGYETKQEKFFSTNLRYEVEDQTAASLRQVMAEREEKEIKTREWQPRDMKYRDRQSDKDGELVDRATLKKQALEERRRREEELRAKQAEEVEHAAQNREKYPMVRTKLQLAKRTLPLDPARKPSDGVNSENGNQGHTGKADVPPPSEMPISSEWMDNSQAACIQTFGAPDLVNQLSTKPWSSTTVAVAPGRNVTGKLAPPLAQSLLANPIIGMQSKPEILRHDMIHGGPSMPDRSKIQDAGDIAAGAADFILGEDDVRRSNNKQNVEESYTAVPEAGNVMNADPTFKHLPSSDWMSWQGWGQKYDQTFRPFNTAGVNLALSDLPLQIPSDQSLWAPSQLQTDSSNSDLLFKGTPWTPIWQTGNATGSSTMGLRANQGRGSAENSGATDYSISGQGMSNLKNTREVKAVRKFPPQSGGPVKKDMGAFPTPSLTDAANSNETSRMAMSSHGPKPGGKGPGNMSYGRVKKIMPRSQGDESSREAIGRDAEGKRMEGSGNARAAIYVPQNVREAAQALSKQRGVGDH
uniref:BAT2 N-terminal domain-containing protein n=1 Tax=Hanusia phi TaxID=3032 RepID=A0A7S0I3C7_9CRYP|mmetsp:Transcript_9088/g.20837  ORF Transcript_9088/g.20837 Transcript_9088/m.20837 type:complete len:1010 (+) Transcript_9088:44-3073(+)